MAPGSDGQDLGGLERGLQLLASSLAGQALQTDRTNPTEHAHGVLQATAAAGADPELTAKGAGGALRVGHRLGQHIHGLDVAGEGPDGLAAGEDLANELVASEDEQAAGVAAAGAGLDRDAAEAQGHLALAALLHLLDLGHQLLEEPRLLGLGQIGGQLHQPELLGLAAAAVLPGHQQIGGKAADGLACAEVSLDGCSGLV